MSSKLISILLLTLLWLPVQAEPVDFSLTDLNGQPVQLSDFKGQWVVVNFWATWCVPCLEEMPELDAFHQKHKNTDAVVIGVNYEATTAEDLREFVGQHFVSLDFPLVLTDGESLSGFKIKALPTTFLVSPTGERVDTHMGVMTVVMLEALIQGFKQSTADL